MSHGKYVFEINPRAIKVSKSKVLEYMQSPHENNIFIYDRSKGVVVTEYEGQKFPSIQELLNKL